MSTIEKLMGRTEINEKTNFNNILGEKYLRTQQHREDEIKINEEKYLLGYTSKQFKGIYPRNMNKLLIKIS